MQGFSRRRLMVGVLTALSATATIASAAPNLALTKATPAKVLYGTDAPVTLTVTDTEALGGAWGYNVGFRDILPPGITYVPGSGSEAPTQILLNQPTAGSTTLIWANVADVSPQSSFALTYRVHHDPAAMDVPAVYVNSAGAYVNMSPNFVPSFTGAGLPNAGSYTGSTTTSATSKLIPLKLTKTASEGEALRGVHNHPITYTLKVDNNLVKSTGGIVVDDYLPAELELLCGAADNTTDAPTNPGSTREYPGAPALAPAPCSTPALVETLGPAFDPDGAGPRPAGVYTHVQWNVGTLAPSASQSITYKAGVPLRRNTMTFTGPTPAPATTKQAANLDNNSGSDILDETAITNYSEANGNYDLNPARRAGDTATATVTSEDLRQSKSASGASLAIGGLLQWTITTDTSEYRNVDNVTITDTVPDGLCPISASVDYDASDGGECDPVAGKNPNVPFLSVAEITAGTAAQNGSWTLKWDKTSDPRLAHMAPNASVVTTFWTKTRHYFQQSGADDLNDPISALDKLTNRVIVDGSQYPRCGAGDPECLGAGTPVSHDQLPNTTIVDEGSAGIVAPPAFIEKDVMTPATVPGSGATTCSIAPLAYQNGPADSFGPGDTVCWRLKVTYPLSTETKNPTVADFLPPGMAALTGTDRTTGLNSAVASAPTFTAGVPESVKWDVGTTVGSNRLIPVGGKVFEHVFGSTITTVSAGASFDIVDNLMKSTYNDSDGLTYPLRDKENYTWSEAEIRLLKGVLTINGAAPGAGSNADPDHIAVQANDVARFYVDVSNVGSRTANTISTRDLLPPEIGCSGVSAISGGGACSGSAPDAQINWTIPTIAGKTLATDAAAKVRLTYDVTVPANVAPNQQLNNRAGVRSYTSPTNTGTPFTYYPTNNVDPAITAVATAFNTTDAADDPSDIYTQDVVLAKSRATSITEAGNNLASEATIGEQVNYTVDVTVPAGSTVYSGKTIDAIPAGQTLLATPAPTVTVNGTPQVLGSAPGAFEVTVAGNTIRLNWASPYVNAPGSGSDVIRLTYSTRVDDVAGNVAPGTVGNTASLDWKNQAAVDQPSRSANTTTTIVEPKIGIQKANNDTDGYVDSGQDVTYTLNITNAASAATAHDSVVVDTLPPGAIPYKGVTAIVAADGDPVGPEGGIWNSTGRTITWRTAEVAALGTIAPGGAVQVHYTAQITAASAAGGAITNTAKVTTTSLAGASATERDGASTTVAGYGATDSNTLRFGFPTVTKTATPDPRTIGQQVTFTVAYTLPAGVQVFDSSIYDTLPDGLAFDGYVSATCVTVGGYVCGSPLDAWLADSSHWMAAEPQGDGSTRLGWWVGDAAEHLVATVPVARRYALTYRAHVTATYSGTGTPVAGAPVVDTNTLQNAANTGWNVTDKQPQATPASIPVAGFDGVPVDTTNPAHPPKAPATTTTNVVEPHLRLNKHVSCDGAAPTTATAADTSDACSIEPGSGPFTYTVVVTNTGTSAAYNAVIADQPDTEIGNVSAVTATSSGAGTVALTNGWTAADPSMAWSVDVLEAGETVTIHYTGTLAASSTLHAGDLVKNTASVTDYFGVSAAARAANPTWTFPNYPNDTNRHPAADPTLKDTVTLTLAMPHITIAKTTGAGTELANAEILKPFTWKVVVTNDSTVVAHDINLSDALPHNWAYTGPATIAVTGPAAQLVVPANQAPVVTGTLTTGRQLDWTAIANLDPGRSVTVTYIATPQPGAEVDPGTATNHVNTAVATTADASGVRSSADGSYADGPDADTLPDSDTAAAPLLAPALAISKKPDCALGARDATCGAPVKAGDTAVPFAIYITNTGTADATNLVVGDVLPAGLVYTNGSQTAVSCNPPGCGSANLPFPAGAAAVAPYTNVVGPAFTQDAPAANTPAAGQTTITYHVASVHPGETIRIYYLVDIPNPWTHNSNITNTASVHSDELPADKFDTGAVQITSKPFWLGLAEPSVKSSVPAMGTALTTEDPIAYTVHYANTGNADASNALLTDAIPANTVYVAGSAGATPAHPVEFKVGGAWQAAEPTNAASVEALRWALGTVTTAGPNHNGDVRFSVKVVKPLANGTVVSNIASITSDEERNYVDDLGVAAPIPPTPIGEPIANGSLTHPVTTAPILGLVKAVSDTDLDTNTEGRRLNYTLTLTNTGNEDASNVVVTDGPPVATKLASISAGGASVACAIDAGPSFTFGTCPANLASVTQIRWSTPSLNTTTSFPVTTGRSPLVVGFGVDVDVPVLNGTVVPNTAKATSTQTLPTPTTSNPVSTTLRAKPVLALTKKVTPEGVVAPGASLTYTLTYTNTGPTDAHAVVLEDSIPANTAYVAGSAAGAQFRVGDAWQPAEPTDAASVQGLRWTIGALDMAAVGSKTFQVKVVDVLDHGTLLPNTAGLTGKQWNAGPGGTITEPKVESDLPPVSGKASNTVQSGPVLSISKKIVGSTTVTVGAKVTYRIHVGVSGNANASPLTVTDKLPKELRFVSGTLGARLVGDVVRWDLGVQKPGYEQDLDIVTTVLTRPTTGRINNLAVASAPNAVSAVRGADASASAGAVLGVARPGEPKFRITKVGSARLTAGGAGTWTITVTNIGPETAKGSVLSDRLPAGMTVVSVQNEKATPGKLRAGSVRWDLGTIAPKATKTVKITLRAGARTVGTFVNRAVVTATNVTGPTNASATFIVRSKRSSRASPAVTG